MVNFAILRSKTQILPNLWNFLLDRTVARSHLLETLHSLHLTNQSTHLKVGVFWKEDPQTVGTTQPWPINPSLYTIGCKGPLIRALFYHVSGLATQMNPSAVLMTTWWRQRGEGCLLKPTFWNLKRGFVFYKPYGSLKTVVNNFFFNSLSLDCLKKN